MKKIDLVFRTVGERTSNLALDLALKNIQPNQVHIIENVKPFSSAVQQMLKINYDCDFVVFMDADCLIQQQMAPFLQENTEPYIDCYVLDKFRGHVHCGVHITRIDVVQAMQQITEPTNDPKYVLRPESRIRDLALNRLQLKKRFKFFKIFHDFLQFYQDIFVKFALRELRSRTDYHQAKIKAYQETWEFQGADLDFKVASNAIRYARENVSLSTSVDQVSKFIKDLPEISIQELNKKKITEKEGLTLPEVEKLFAQYTLQNNWKNKSQKIFGIGLSQTGNESLTLALNLLGFNVAHYPDDEIILQEIMSENYNFSLLNDLDGITDITVAPFYSQLDQRFPNSKFILTVRDKESWLKSIEAHFGTMTFEGFPSNENTMNLRRMLRVAVYGTYSFNKKVFSEIYDRHYQNVIEYFKSRPDSLLILNIFNREAWEKLCSFLDLPVLHQPFPFKK